MCLPSRRACRPLALANSTETARKTLEFCAPNWVPRRLNFLQTCIFGVQLACIMHHQPVLSILCSNELGLVKSFCNSKVSFSWFVSKCPLGSCPLRHHSGDLMLTRVLTCIASACFANSLNPASVNQHTFARLIPVAHAITRARLPYSVHPVSMFLAPEMRSAARFVLVGLLCLGVCTASVSWQNVSAAMDNYTNVQRGCLIVGISGSRVYTHCKGKMIMSCNSQP